MLRILAVVWLLVTGLLGGCTILHPEDTLDDAAMPPMDMAGMPMGDPDATPADALEGAVLRQGAWHRLVTAPVAYADVTGTAQLAVHAQGTTVTLRLAHLPPHQPYMAHVHVDSCKVLGGDHFQFDPQEGDMPPNEIHLAFTSQADGTGFMTVANPHQAGEAARSIIVHQMADDLKLLCANLHQNRN